VLSSDHRESAFELMRSPKRDHSLLDLTEITPFIPVQLIVATSVPLIGVVNSNWFTAPRAHRSPLTVSPIAIVRALSHNRGALSGLVVGVGWLTSQPLPTARTTIAIAMLFDVITPVSNRQGSRRCKPSG
jgi:hypothetical protein